MTGSDFLKSGNIEDEIMSREWTLNDVLNMDKTVADIVQKLIMGMDIESKYDIVKDTQIRKDGKYNEITLGELFTEHCRLELSEMVQFIVNRYLKTAQVKFNEGSIQNKKLDSLPEKQLGTVDENVNADEKIVTLKEKIRKDSKMLSEKEMKEQGMI